MSDSEIQGERLAAQQLVESGRVLEVRILHRGTVVTGIVADGEPHTRGARHRVYIRRFPGATREPAREVAECSCGARSTCVHVEAVSLAAAREGAAAPCGASRTVDLSSAPAPREGVQLQRLYYVLEPVMVTGRVAGWQVSIWVGHEPAGDPDGPPRSPCRFALRPGMSSGEYPRYVDARDREILQGFALQIGPPWGLGGGSGAELLLRMLATGRTRAHSVTGAALRPGPPRSVRFKWSMTTDSRQRLTWDPPLTVIVETQPLMYLDPESHEAGPLELAWPARVVQVYLGRRVPPEEVDAVNTEIRSNAAIGGFPQLEHVAVRAEPLRSLTGRLRLAAGPEAMLCYVYNGIAVESDWVPIATASMRLGSADGVIEVPRDLKKESELRSQLNPWIPRTRASQEWLRLVTVGVPALRAQGWEIAFDSTFPYRVVEPGEWYADLRSDRQADWFDLTLGVVVDGRRVNLLPALTRYLQSSFGGHPEQGQDTPAWEPSCFSLGESCLLRLEDGTHLAVPLARIRRIAETLVELFDRTGPQAREALTLPHAQRTRLAQLAGELDLAVHADDPTLQVLARDLRQPIVPLAAPAGFPEPLRPYQQAGLGWLQFLRQHRLGGLLADDMGLGKTVQALAHIGLEKEAGRLRHPVLIVAPVSALPNWRSEIQRFLPHLTVLLWHGTHRKESRRRLDRTDLILTGYALLQLDADILQARQYSLVIFDEAQAMKNPAAKSSIAARGLRTEHRLCLTGTPVENHLGELWSLFELLQPGFLGHESEFQRHYRTPIEKHGDARRARALSERIAPFLLRRTKESVATELPPKTEILQRLELDERQRDFYDGIRLMMHRRVQEIIREQGVSRSQITILDALMKLRQACCDPRLLHVDSAREIPSAKLEWLSGVLPELVAEGRRILLFSQFTSMIELIEARLAELDIPHVQLTGKTRNRAAVIERFQSGGVPLFLISLRAGGTALNLTAADTVIHYDPWWNPAVEAQATDRAHRIGQDKPVFVYKLIAAGTVEERIMDLKERKQALASRLYVEQEAASSSLTATDVEALFAP